MSAKLLRSFRRLWASQSDTEFKSRHLDSVYQAVTRHLPLVYALFAFRVVDSLRFEVPAFETMAPPLLFFFLKFYPENLLVVISWLTAALLVIAASLPRNHWLSRVALLLFVQWGALGGAFGLTDHGHRPMIWMALCLIFLPPRPFTASRSEKMRVLNGYWFALLFLNLSYILSGLWKLVLGGGYQLFTDNFGIWNPQSVGYVIAEYDARTAQNLPLTHWFIENSAIIWPFFLVAIYLESMCWIMFFRPSLWSFFAAGLMLMHIGTRMTLNITFDTMFLVAGVLNLSSPFFKEKRFIETLKELPGIYWLHKKNLRKFF